MKKIGIILCLSSSLFAASAAQATWEGNWLLGVSGGWAWNSNRDADVTIFHTPGGEVTNFHVGDLNDNNNNFFWGLLAGYQAHCGGWLVGGEVNVDWRHDHGHDDGRSFSVVDPIDGVITGSIDGANHHNAVVGLTARLGYEVSCYFMPYIRLGAEVTRRNDVTFAAFADPAGAPVAYSVVYNTDRSHRWGFVGGLGAEFPLPVFPELSLRAEYNYHSHSKHDDISALASNLGTLYTVSGDGNRHENTGKASLVWNFL
jgi:opacity protein-like surface antigen